jgi:hypothetical protein
MISAVEQRSDSQNLLQHPAVTAGNLIPSYVSVFGAYPSFSGSHSFCIPHFIAQGYFFALSLLSTRGITMVVELHCSENQILRSCWSLWSS